MQVCYNPCILKKTCIDKNARRKKRNAAGGADNVFGFIVCNLARVIYVVGCNLHLFPEEE